MLRVLIGILCFYTFFANLLFADICVNNTRYSIPFLSVNDNYDLGLKTPSFSDLHGDIDLDAYLQGDIDILSQNAPLIVNEISSVLLKNTGVRVYINVVKDTLSSYNVINNDRLSIDDVLDSTSSNFQNRRLYEDRWLSNIDGKYAVIFLFYNDHAITLKSNLEFLKQKDIQNLLEDYAYPYLPAESVGTDKYDDGINEGVSNLYLALSHVIAKKYNFDLGAPKPMEKPSDMTKVVIYAMLIVLIGLFILVRFGLLAFKKSGGTHDAK